MRFNLFNSMAYLNKPKTNTHACSCIYYFSGLHQNLLRIYSNAYTMAISSRNLSTQGVIPHQIYLDFIDWRASGLLEFRVGTSGRYHQHIRMSQNVQDSSSTYISFFFRFIFENFDCPFKQLVENRIVSFETRTIILYLMLTS